MLPLAPSKQAAIFVNIFLFDFSTGRSEMSAGRCRLHSVRSDPFHLGAPAYFLGGVFLPCPKPYKRSSEWNLLIHLVVWCPGRSGLAGLEGSVSEGTFAFLCFNLSFPRCPQQNKSNPILPLRYAKSSWENLIVFTKKKWYFLGNLP